MEPTIVLEHLAHTVTDGFEYRAECSCGWVGEWTDDQADADDAAHEHPGVAVGPPDGLDATLSELLDLQEDLAEAVIWLADNWSADLPAPLVSPRWATEPGSHALSLLVPCPDTATVERIAGLIGNAVELTASTASTAGRFGELVRLQVFTGLDNGTAAL